MSSQISKSTLGTKENPIFISSIENLKQLKDSQFYQCSCIKCGKFFSKGFYKKSNNMIYENFLFCKKCLTEKTKIEKYGSLENANKIMQDNIKKSMIEKYGVENPGQLKNHFEKCQETMKKHYGSLENAYKESQEKLKKTKKEKYGNENFNNREKAEKTFKEKYNNKSYLGSKECIKKTKEICQKKYGVDNVSQLKEVQEQKELTTFLHYGKRFYLQTEEGKVKVKETEESIKKRIEKMKQTNKEKYGNEFLFGSNYFKEKSAQTCLEKYGAENYSQTEECREKIKSTMLERYGVLSFGGINSPTKKKFIYNNIYFDSSWELVYFIWLSDNKIEFKYHNGDFFEYSDSKGKIHRYYPDFLVNGEYQEIKGEQFFNENNEPFSIYDNDFWWEKYNCMKENGVKILRYENLTPIFEYIDFKYGKDYIKNFIKK